MTGRNRRGCPVPFGGSAWRVRSMMAVAATVGIAHLGGAQGLRVAEHQTHTVESVVPLHAGRNLVDILGDGRPGAVEVAERQNFNAHGHHLAIFFVRAPEFPGSADSAVAWQVVPFAPGVDSVADHDLVRTVEGADCTLQDLRVVRREPGQPVSVVIAQRELGRSYADSAAVRFEYYELHVNRGGVVGYPAYYFARTRVVSARRQYCDVDDAFDRELGLGTTGLLEWTGPR